MDKYHYTESGLVNVWLANGYNVRKTAEGEFVSITDADELHRVIGRALTRKPHLTGAEFRYLRKELGLSQKKLGEMIGASEESISLWERKGKVPRGYDQLMRFLYSGKIDGDAKISEIIGRFVELDKFDEDKMLFEDTKRGWKKAA